MADSALKIAALIGVSAAITSVGYTYFHCAYGPTEIAVSIPVFVLALITFGLALGLTDETFGTFRDMDLWSGAWTQRVTRHALFIVGGLFEMSLFVVATQTFLSSVQLQSCAS